MPNISLTASMRSNLLSLQQTGALMGTVQERLSTGKKVNSAIDNPSSYYTAVSLNSRAGDLDALLDSMGQAVSTVKAATEGIETATTLLEQMQSVTEQAISEPTSVVGTEPEIATFALRTSDITDFSGYTEITSDMTSAEIASKITNGAKLVLSGDVVLDASLIISASDVVINGNGHKITYTGQAGDVGMIGLSSANLKLENIELDYTGNGQNIGAAIMSMTSKVELADIKINVNGDNTHGVYAARGSEVSLDTDADISVNGAGAHKVVNGDTVAAKSNGEANTKAIVKELGSDALAAYATIQYVPTGVATNDATFGIGTWYLPSIDELAEMYGTDFSQITADYSGITGANGDNFADIQDALDILATKGADAEKVSDRDLWSSSESWNYSAPWCLSSDGEREPNSKTTNNGVRGFQFVENCFTPSNFSDPTKAPKVGYVMYADKSYGSASSYDRNKVAVGIITDISDDQKSATLMSLKSLGTMAWSNDYVDVAGVDDFIGGVGSKVTIGGIAIDGNGGSNTGGNIGANVSYQEQFNQILSQYDMLINDASYKGINLLRGENMTVNFNEDRSSSLVLKGRDISSANIGLTIAEWSTISDAKSSLEEVRSAILNLRNLASELGNGYSILTSRQNFTESLINVLTEGADKLTLADMNEESANMLALQTRQQLAINSLSLASQASQSVLKLF